MSERADIPALLGLARIPSAEVIGSGILGPRFLLFSAAAKCEVAMAGGKWCSADERDFQVDDEQSLPRAYPIDEP